MSPLFQHRKAIGAALAVIILVAVMSVTSRERERITLLEELLVEMIAPLQRGVTTVATLITDTVTLVVELNELRTENTRLEQELDRYRALEHRFQETFAENRRLSGLLGFKSRTEVPVTTARIIGRNPDNWFGTIVLDRGSRHGVTRNAIAVTDLGVVGRVIRVTGNTATVLLITDPDSGIGALVMRSRDPGVVLGQAGEAGTVTMRFFTREADVEPGDLVLTSGMGALFPRGLVIGRVVTILDDDERLMTRAVIRPLTDLRRLEQVLIITSPDMDVDFEETDEPIPAAPLSEEGEPRP